MEYADINPDTYLQDAQCLEHLIDEHGGQLLRLCTLYLGDAHLAEDAVQETLIRAWRGMRSFRGESSENTWVTRIAMNVCKSWLRTPWKRRRASSEELDSLFAPPDDPDIDDTLPRAIMALPRKYREVVVLHYYQELKAREIAELLKLPVSTVTARLSRARKKLREHLKGWYYDEEP